MALYSPVPSISALPALAAHDSPSYQSPSPSPPAPSPRHISRSERMLMAALRRADGVDKHSADEHDYFSRAMDNAWSRSQSVNTSPVRASKRLSPHAAPIERSPSPLTVRGVERELARQHRGRTPSPSPHPYRPSGVQTPNFSRTQTAPSRSHLHQGSRPSSPAQVARRSTSPQHHRKESSAASSSLKRTAHEELLRSRLESVLAKQQQQDAIMADGASSVGTRSRGPSFSRTAPPTAPAAAGPQSTSTGDQWTWQQQTANVPVINLTSVSPSTPSSPKATPRRSPSVSQATPLRTASSSHISGMVSPTRMRESIMITPPPSPPHHHQQEQTASSSSSRDSSQGRTQLGNGRPSRSPSKSGGASRVTPPPFDARTASLALKQQHGYVSFCEIEGLGEPEGMDGSDSEGEDDSNDLRGRGRWWEVWRK